MTDLIRDVIAHKGDAVDTVTPEMTAFAAVEQMNTRRIGAVLVVDDGRPIGIFTERDVLVRVVARGLDPTTTLVRKVMTTAPVTITPDATITQAMSVITDSRCRHLPVVDGARLCGIVSIGDLLGWIVRDRERTIADLHDFIRAA